MGVIFDFDTIKEDQNEYPNMIFAFKNDRWIWHFNKESGLLHLKINYFQPILIREFNVRYHETVSFVRYVVEKKFKRMDMKSMLDAISKVSDKKLLN